MTKLKVFKLVIVCVLLFTSQFLQAQNWPNWRGPLGDGTSVETNLPTQWDSITNVIWKVPVPGFGHSSPIVWEDKLFTISALLESEERILLCYNCENGELLWQKTVFKSNLEGKHKDNSFASGTPATDGKLVYAAFLNEKDVVVVAYDYEGNQVWKQTPGTFYSPHGFSCSPVIYKNRVIINGNSKEGGFLAALDKTTGDIIWKIDHAESAHSFSTPIVRTINGKEQLFFGGNKTIASYNPNDGTQYWFVEGPSEDFCSSPVYSEKAGLLFMSSAWPQRILMAIKPDGSGNVTQSKVLWQTKEGAMYVPSAVCTDDYLFTTMTSGKVHCLNLLTGEIVWTETLGKQYSSPVFADGLVYMPNDEGVITVIQPADSLIVISKNSIGERMNASPAISKGKIYLRGEKNLFCIGGNSTSKLGKKNSLPFENLTFANIGANIKKGEINVENNKLEIKAGGADIWGTKDEFAFGYQTIIGDFDVCVQLLSLSKAHQYTKAGIMARTDLTDNSTHVYFQVFPDNTPRNKNNGGCEFQYRSEKGGQMKAIYPNPETAGNKFNVNFPNTWIRLKRTGDIFDAYVSSDKKSWELYCSFTQKLPGEVLVGLAVTSHNSDELTTAKFAQMEWE